MVRLDAMSVHEPHLAAPSDESAPLWPTATDQCCAMVAPCSTAATARSIDFEDAFQDGDVCAENDDITAQDYPGADGCEVAAGNDTSSTTAEKSAPRRAPIRVPELKPTPLPVDENAPKKQPRRRARVPPKAGDNPKQHTPVHKNPPRTLYPLKEAPRVVAPEYRGSFGLQDTNVYAPGSGGVASPAVFNGTLNAARLPPTRPIVSALLPSSLNCRQYQEEEFLERDVAPLPSGGDLADLLSYAVNCQDQHWTSIPSFPAKQSFTEPTSATNVAALDSNQMSATTPQVGTGHLLWALQQSQSIVQVQQQQIANLSMMLKLTGVLGNGGSQYAQQDMCFNAAPNLPTKTGPQVQPMGVPGTYMNKGNALNNFDSAWLGNSLPTAPTPPVQAYRGMPSSTTVPVGPVRARRHSDSVAGLLPVVTPQEVCVRAKSATENSGMFAGQSAGRPAMLGMTEELARLRALWQASADGMDPSQGGLTGDMPGVPEGDMSYPGFSLWTAGDGLSHPLGDLMSGSDSEVVSRCPSSSLGSVSGPFVPVNVGQQEDTTRPAADGVFGGPQNLWIDLLLESAQ